MSVAGGRGAPRSPTPQQGAALEVRGASVALRAGAGCGKTLVLTERFVRALGDPDEPHRLAEIVALTFTDKAARELRDRVRRACRERLDSGAEDAPRWLAVLRGLEAAPICTFHTFCSGLLRRFAVEAGVDPGFAVLEESIAAQLRGEALAAQVRSWLAAGDDDLAALAVEFGLARVLDALDSLVPGRSPADFTPWAEREPADAVARWRTAFETTVRPAILADLVASSGPLFRLLAENPCSHEKMRERQKFLLEHLALIAEFEGDSLEGLLADLRDNAKVQGGGRAEHWPSAEVYAAVRDGLSRFRDQLDRAAAALVVDEAASLAAAERGRRLARLAAGATEAYERAKRTSGLLDFDDLLLKTRDLLRDRGAAVRSALEGATRLILVDEFQDTDPIQAEILGHLAGEGAGDGRLFLVGDLKQSIYRFRGARPELFDRFRDRFPEPGRRALNENFRSGPAIIAFVNLLFAGEFPGPDHELRPIPSAPLGPGPFVTFLWAAEPGAEGANVHRRRQAEARWIARHLAARLREGWSVRDRKTGAVRPAHAGDVTLLFRTLNDAAPYESALAEAGLDYHVVGGSAFFAQQEVIDLINLLSAIEDPADAVSLAGALRGPAFAVSDEGLFWLSAAGKGDLLDGFHGSGRVPDLSEADHRRIERARDLLPCWRNIKDHVGIAPLIGRVLDDSGYEAALMGEFLGPRKRANVRKLARLARRFDAQGGFALGDFVARLRADLRKPPKEEQAATTDEEGQAVRLMTIHQAKGLEFPIVVVPDLDRDAPNAREAFAFDPDLGLLLRDPDTDEDSGTNLGWTIRRHVERREEEKEALRLFYVATTRARDHLILSASLAADAPPSSPALRLLDARFDRATGAPLAPIVGAQGPEVAVVAAEPRAITSTTPRKRPPLRAVARRIERLACGAPPAAPPPSRSPRVVDLDPSASLPPAAARVDALIRAILADPQGVRASGLPRLAARLARVLVPAVPPGRVDEAVDALRPWLESPSAARIARAPEVLLAVPWSLAWPPGSDRATVYLGRLDLAYRDPDGRWHLVGLSLDAEPEPRARLRLLLSCLAAGRLGHGPVADALGVRLGAGFAEAHESDFGPAAIDAAIGEFNAC